MGVSIYSPLALAVIRGVHSPPLEGPGCYLQLLQFMIPITLPLVWEWPLLEQCPFDSKALVVAPSCQACQKRHQAGGLRSGVTRRWEVER